MAELTPHTPSPGDRPVPGAPQPSRAAIKGHPIHPMLVAFPIVCLVLAFATDIGFVSTGDGAWTQASTWLLGVGVVTGLLAAIFGVIDFVSIKAAREHHAGWVHAAGNVVVMLIALVNWLMRLDDPVSAAWPLGTILSGATALLLVVTGWYGGELSYRHKIGVMPSPDYATDREPEPERQREPGPPGREPIEA